MTTIAPDLSSLRERFPALARLGPGGEPFVWADCPGGSQVPDTVIEAMAGQLRHGVSNTHGAFEASEEVDALIGEARRAAADVTGADPGEIVFGPNATTLLLSLSRAFARTLLPGDEVVVTTLDHDANVRPWILAAEDAGATVRWVDVRTDDVTIDLGSFDAALSDRTRLVAFTLASNAVGTIPAAAELTRRAHAAGAIVAVDAVHAAQHRSIDVRALDADILACSPYKFFGPHLGILAVRRELLETWTPYKLRPSPDTAPERWETGTQNHEGLAGLIAAAEYLAGVGRIYASPEDDSRRAAVVAAFDAIGAHEQALSLRFLDGVAGLPDVRLFGIADPTRVDERTPTFAVRVGEQHPLETSAELARRGIFTWDGHYYAISVMERLGLLDTGGAVRIGFCHYHSQAEVDRVLDALDTVT
ncbi:MAG: cysteine desulfurase-like protein [Actinomycetota bacterium]|nr:cysteine desulfurase-like protein [Actinomycetota bacterium]